MIRHRVANHSIVEGRNPETFLDQGLMAGDPFAAPPQSIKKPTIGLPDCGPLRSNGVRSIGAGDPDGALRWDHYAVSALAVERLAGG